MRCPSRRCPSACRECRGGKPRARPAIGRGGKAGASRPGGLSTTGPTDAEPLPEARRQPRHRSRPLRGTHPRRAGNIRATAEADVQATIRHTSTPFTCASGRRRKPAGISRPTPSTPWLHLSTASTLSHEACMQRKHPLLPTCVQQKGSIRVMQTCATVRPPPVKTLLFSIFHACSGLGGKPEKVRRPRPPQR